MTHWPSTSSALLDLEEIMDISGTRVLASYWIIPDIIISDMCVAMNLPVPAYAHQANILQLFIG